MKCSACGCLLTIPKPDKQVAASGTRVDQPTDGEAREFELARFWTRTTLLVLGTLVGLAVIALAFGNHATRLFVVLIILTTLNGYWMGASKVAAGIVGMVAAMLFAVPLGKAFEGVCSAAFGVTGLANRMLSIGVSGLVLIVVVAVVLSILIGRRLKKKPAWGRFDKLMGTGLGLLEGTLLAVLVIWAILAVAPMLARDLAEAAGSERSRAPGRVAKLLVATSEVARESAVGRLVGASNPLKEMRVITLLRNAQAVLTDDAGREAFMNHPAMQEVQQRPAVQHALELLAAELRLADRDDDLSDEDVLMLLRSPRVLEILDETRLLEELSPIAGQIEQALNAALDSPP